MEAYLRIAADLHAGREASIRGDGITVKEMCNHYLTYPHRRAEAGEIGPRWFEDCRYVLKAFAKQVGQHRCASGLVPDDFGRFRQRLLACGWGTGSVSSTIMNTAVPAALSR